MTTFEGDHNSRRPEYFYDSAAIFLYQCLQVEQLLKGPNQFTPEEMEKRKKEAKEKKTREINAKAGEIKPK